MPTVEPVAPIVVGVDRPSSGAGVAYGATEALRTGRSLELVHVAPELNGWLTTVGRDALRLAMMRADADVAGQVPVRSTLLRGDVVDELAGAARLAALLVLEQVPPRQQRRSGRAVTVALAARVDIPMVVVPAGWIGRQRSILTVGFDPAAPDDTALRAAVAQARLSHATLRVVVAGARGDLDDHLMAAGGDACDVAVELSSADSAEALRQAGLTSDLVVAGRHRPSATSSSRLGPVGQALLDDPVCPVLLTPPGHVHGRSPTRPSGVGAAQEPELGTDTGVIREIRASTSHQSPRTRTRMTKVLPRLDGCP
jgi:nucleotide-binding universal stress UspA family protein